MTINRKVSARELRRQLAAEAENASAALQNEQLTRMRVEALEQAVAAWWSMSFWQRLRWLVRGWQRNTDVRETRVQQSGEGQARAADAAAEDAQVGV